MFKWITVLQFLFVVHIYMKEVTSKRTINVGTVLFDKSDFKKDCWTYESVLLLMSRSLMQMMLPEEYVSEYEKSNVDRLIPYLYSTLNTMRSLSKGSAQQIMVLALSDVIGGYMRSQLLPIIKTEYYQGNIAFSETEQLYFLYGHLKSLLRTNGEGWRIPPKVDIKLNDIPSLRISVKKTSEDICEHFDVGHLSGKPNVITIPVPHLDNDIDPQSIAVPFRRQSVCSIQEASSAHMVRKYYIDGMQCLLATASEEAVTQFNVEMDGWLKKSVMPLLELEELYPAFGGVYRVFATVQRVRAIKRNALLDERVLLAVARNGDRNIPFLSGRSPQSTDAAVAVIKRLPIQQHPAFVASVPQETVPDKSTTFLKYSDINHYEQLKETRGSVPVERSSGFRNGEIVSKPYVVHVIEHLPESVSDKQPNSLFDLPSSENAYGETSVDTSKVQITPVFLANTTIFLSLQRNPFSLQPLQTRSSLVPLYFHGNVTNESKDPGIFDPSNAASNYSAQEETHIFKSSPSLHSLSSSWTIRPPDSYDVRTLSNISVNLDKNVEPVETYIKNYYSVSLPLNCSPSIMSSMLLDTSPKSYFFTKSKDAYFNLLSDSSNDLERDQIHYNNDKQKIHSRLLSMSSLSDITSITENTPLYEFPIVSDIASSTLETKGSTFVSEPSALSLFLRVPTSFLPYSPLPTSSNPDILTSESREMSSVDYFLTSPPSLLVNSILPHSVVEAVSTNIPAATELTNITSSAALASQEVVHAQSNNSTTAPENMNTSPVSVKSNSASVSVSQPSYEDKHLKIWRTSHLKSHKNVSHSKLHEKPRFRFLKPFYISESAFAKLDIVSPLYKHQGSGGTRKNITIFKGSKVKSTTVDHSLMVGIPRILLGSQQFPNGPHTQNTFANEKTRKNALSSHNAHVGNGIHSRENSISFRNFPINDSPQGHNALTVLSKNESIIRPNTTATTIRSPLISKIQPVTENANLKVSSEMFGENNRRSESSAWKRNALKDFLTFPPNTHSDQAYTLETFVVPYGSVVSAFESGNNFLLSSILPPVGNVINNGGRMPNFLSMDLNDIDENPECMSANSDLNGPNVSSEKLETENRAYSRDPVNTDERAIKLILKKADHSQECSQTKEKSKGCSLWTNNVVVDDDTLGDFTKEYNINITLVTPKQVSDISEIMLHEISSPEEKSSRDVITSEISVNKRKGIKLFPTSPNVTKNINPPVEEFLLVELEDDEGNKEVHDEKGNKGSSKSQPKEYSEENGNIDHTKMKYENLFTQTQTQRMKNLKIQEITEHIKENNEESKENLGSNDILGKEKLQPSRETNYQKIKKKLFKPRPTKAKFQEFDTQGNEYRKQYIAQGNVGSINKDNEYPEDDYDYDDEEEWKKERPPTGNDVTDGRRKSKISNSYTVKSIYEEDPNKTSPKFPFIDTLMQNGMKPAVSSLIVSPDLGIFNVILMVILGIILALCRCIREQPSETHRHVRIFQSEPHQQYGPYPFRKLMSSLSSFYRIVSFRTGARGNVSHVPLSKLRKAHSPKGFRSGGTTWTCECPSNVDAPCSTSLRLTEEGRNLNSIRSEFLDNSDLLRRLDEALNVIRAANTILSKPHSCPHLFPEEQTPSPPHSRSMPTFSGRSTNEHTQPSSPFQSWVYRKTYWPYPTPSDASWHSEEFERELLPQEGKYSSMSKAATEPSQSDNEWSSQEPERKLPSQKRYSAGTKAKTQPLQSDSCGPSQELGRNLSSEQKRCSLATHVFTECSQSDSDISSCISIDIPREIVNESKKQQGKGSGRRKKCKECGLFISSPSSHSDTSHDTG